MIYRARCNSCSAETGSFQYEEIPADPIQLHREFEVCLACSGKSFTIAEKPNLLPEENPSDVPVFDEEIE